MCCHKNFQLFGKIKVAEVDCQVRNREVDNKAEIVEKNIPQKAVASKYSVQSQNSQNTKDRTNLVDSVINSIIETQNKKMVQWEYTKRMGL